MKKNASRRRVQAVVFELIKLGQSGFLNRVKCRLTQTVTKKRIFPQTSEAGSGFILGVSVGNGLSGNRAD